MARGSVAALGLLVIVACAPGMGVRNVTSAEWFARESRSALFDSKPSQRTQHFLLREGYSRTFDRDPIAVAKDLHARLREQGERLVAFHLAEICYLEARRSSGLQHREFFYYFSAVRYAYAYLFDEKLYPPVNEFDPLHRWACDIYNRALARVLELAGEAPPGAYRGATTLATLSGSCTVLFQTLRSAWDLSNLRELKSAYRYEVTGFGAASKAYGVGSPFIAVRSPPLPEETEETERFLGKVRMAYPITLFVRFDGSIRDTSREVPERAMWEVYDPFLVSEIEVAGKTLPLETDFTTPLAYALGIRPKVGKLSAMLRPEKFLDQAGLSMLQPYDPEKIPLVFVHGLMSSELTWIPLLNDLIADPELRERYQLWYFFYPTGNPVLLSGSLLRSALLEIQAAYDPVGTNEAFNQMIICAHSMGGLLTRLQLFDSGGESVREILGGIGLEDLRLPADQERLLRQVFYFERLPFVKRVIFMAVPHRGSGMAEGWVGRLGERLVSFTGRLSRLQRDLADRVKSLGRGTDSRKFRKITSGVGNLSPRSEFMKFLAGHPPPADLDFHSVIGDNRAPDSPGGTDGVVPYESSHMPGALSEKIIESGHNVQQQPEAVIELRRILRLHLAEVDAARSGASP